MKILHVIPDMSPATGGPVVSTHTLAQAQSALGHDVEVVSTDWGLSRPPQIPGVTVTLFPCRLKKWRWAPGLYRYLCSALRTVNIVNIESLWQYPVWAAGRACRKTGTPYIVSTNGMLDVWSMNQKTWKKLPYLGLIERSTLCGAAALHATTDAEAMQSFFSDWNESVFVLPLGLPPEAFELAGRADFFRRHPQIPPRYVLFFGRLHYKKQPDVLIRAFSRIARAHPDIGLVLIGPSAPSYQRELQDLARRREVASRVFFLGPMHGQAKREALRSATVFALPSRQENFGIAVAEAMAAECPVIISDRVNLADVVRAADAGAITAPDEDDTARALDIMLRNPELQSSMGRNGRRYALEHFTAAGVAAQKLEVYEDIISGLRKSSAWRTELKTPSPPALDACPRG